MPLQHPNIQHHPSLTPQEMTPEPDHIEYDPVEHEPPPEQADPSTPKHQEKIKFHPFINGKKFSQEFICLKYYLQYYRTSL